MPIVVVALALHDVRWAPLHKEPLMIAAITIGTFFGILWIVALGEELLFRGVIARALMNGGSSPVIAVVKLAASAGSHDAGSLLQEGVCKKPERTCADRDAPFGGDNVADLLYLTCVRLP